MVSSLKERPLKRQPAYRNIHVTDLMSYRLPPAGWVSILHRVSGAAMFLLLPFTIWAGECQWWPLLGLAAIPLAIKPIRVLETRTDGPALNKCLAATGGLLAVYSLLVTIGLLISV